MYFPACLYAVQYKFYANGQRRLLMCESFCDKILDACRDAKLKGEYVRDLYRTGVAFCKSRRFDVSRVTNDSCFSYSSKNSRSDRWRNLLLNTSNRRTCPAVFFPLLFYMISSLLFY